MTELQQLAVRLKLVEFMADVLKATFITNSELRLETFRSLVDRYMLALEKELV
jgi:CRISPR/Cas system type I-B associated protein Csh2 (Cas7 group RAMP superfamily)